MFPQDKVTVNQMLLIKTIQLRESRQDWEQVKQWITLKSISWSFSMVNLKTNTTIWQVYEFVLKIHQKMTCKLLGKAPL